MSKVNVFTTVCNFNLRHRRWRRIIHTHQFVPVWSKRYSVICYTFHISKFDTNCCRLWRLGRPCTDAHTWREYGGREASMACLSKDLCTAKNKVLPFQIVSLEFNLKVGVGGNYLLYPAHFEIYVGWKNNIHCTTCDYANASCSIKKYTNRSAKVSYNRWKWQNKAGSLFWISGFTLLATIVLVISTSDVPRLTTFFLCYLPHRFKYDNIVILIICPNAHFKS